MIPAYRDGTAANSLTLSACWGLQVGYHFSEIGPVQLDARLELPSP